MKTLIPTLLFVVFAGAAQAAGPSPARKPLPANECIDPTQINEWSIVDARTALVRTGPKRYLVTLQHDCPRLGTPPPGLMFRPNASNALVNRGRICGEVGETVQSRYQPPCAIRSVQRIDKARFDQLNAKAMRHGSGAEMPTAMPAH